MTTYEFNISRHGKHVCYVSSRNNLDKQQALDLWVDLRQKFHSSEGWKVTMETTITKKTSTSFQ